MTFDFTDAVRLVKWGVELTFWVNGYEYVVKKHVHRSMTSWTVQCLSVDERGSALDTAAFYAEFPVLENYLLTEQIDTYALKGMVRFNNTVVVNTTPHDITITLPDGEVLTIRPSGYVVRVEERITHQTNIGGIPVAGVEYRHPYMVPAMPHVYFIVSGMVADTLTHRDDLLVPYFTERDDKGRTITWQGFRFGAKG